MPGVPSDLKYTRDHGWARLDGDGRLTAGITDFAAESLGEIDSIDLPEAGAAIEAGEVMGQVSYEGTIWDIYAPVTGTCVEVNSECKDNPAAVSQDPYGEGWLIVVDPTGPEEFDGLMPPEEYDLFVEEEGEL